MSARIESEAALVAWFEAHGGFEFLYLKPAHGGDTKVFLEHSDEVFFADADAVGYGGDTMDGTTRDKLRVVIIDRSEMAGQILARLLAFATDVTVVGRARDGEQGAGGGKGRVEHSGGHLNRSRQVVQCSPMP